MAYRKDYCPRHHEIHIYDPQTFEVGVANGSGFFFFCFFFFVCVCSDYFTLFIRELLQIQEGTNLSRFILDFISYMCVLILCGCPQPPTHYILLLALAEYCKAREKFNPASCSLEETCCVDE